MESSVLEARDWGGGRVECELPLVQDKQSGLFISGKKGVGVAVKLFSCSVP